MFSSSRKRMERRRLKSSGFTGACDVHHGTAIRIGDYVYGSSGDFGPAFFAAVNVKTGEIAYQDRTFPKSNLVLADGKLIILDEDGNLALATATPTELKVISKVSVLKNLAWTVPTLVGTKLYLRDRRTITALDLKLKSVNLGPSEDQMQEETNSRRPGFCVVLVCCRSCGKLAAVAWTRSQRREQRKEPAR